MSWWSFEAGGYARGEVPVAVIKQRRGAAGKNRSQQCLLNSQMIEDMARAAVMLHFRAAFVSRVGAAVLAGHFVPVSVVRMRRIHRSQLHRHAASRLPAEAGRQHGQQEDQHEKSGKQHGHVQAL